MSTVLYSIAFTTYPRNIFLTNIAGSKGCQTKPTSSASFFIKHSLEDVVTLIRIGDGDPVDPNRLYGRNQLIALMIHHIDCFKINLYRIFLSF